MVLFDILNYAILLMLSLFVFFLNYLLNQILHFLIFLYITSVAIREKKEISTSLNLKPNQMFLINKYKNQARYFKEKELRKILEELINLDYNYKNGLIDLQLGLETILCENCS